MIFMADVDAEDEGANDTDKDGWTADGIKLLCELHIPGIEEYNSGDLGVKRHYWRNIQDKLHAKGFSGEAFDSSTKISKKWRYLLSQYNRVKDNNGKTGRGKMRYKHYEVMREIFQDQVAGNVVTDPEFLEPGEPAPGGRGRRERGGKNANKTHQELMRDIQERYNRESLALQKQALDLEKEKLELLRQLLNK